MDAKKDNLILLKLMEKLLSFGAEKKQLHNHFLNRLKRNKD